MKQTPAILCLAFLTLLQSGCSGPGGRAVGISNLQGASGAPTVQRAELVTITGRAAAVLSLHQKTPLVNGCRYGLTLTNNLPFEITDLGLRFSANSEDGVTLQGVTSSFFAVKPTQQRFREINFQVECERIHAIEVSDPGRCIMGELTRRSARPGECLDQVDIPQSPLATLVKKQV